MSNELKAWKNPYYRNMQGNQTKLPIENPIMELKEEELLQIQGGTEDRWAETILTTLTCAAASYFLGNPGHMCTLTVECQKQCN
ncbi:plantaricin C family lantibiotic [Mangrovibacillus sp. Mu-81]|uniref:plantaricin C family lantibiotic n=1 Tax=Mangrovibacillus sp. Mu-81 TaxID=3121478 RepID=UPI002FE43572